ncbi:antibiotic biosynthesis monooxygenase [Exiguobacterium sp. KRL4]|uniref:antibiotic biosynthesis monooxygenase n=1 Tax=Exiguobacterium TaxID=33986 RepID=UPI0008F834BA|nr:antibiotic biosynthesis monooxygenase [Exiguobacterium sp. KRL4]OIN66566.1 antibiotic biosynthesis monooxygenase [Exiguobacterium sp. KRL4]
MWIVMNQLRVQNGKADQVAARFQTTKGIEQMEGFIRMQVLVDLSQDEHDIVTIMTTWEKQAHFHAWQESQAYKGVHKKRDEGTSEVKPLVLSNAVTEYAVVADHTHA